MDKIAALKEASASEARAKAIEEKLKQLQFQLDSVRRTLEKKLEELGVPHGLAVWHTSLGSWDYQRATEVLNSGNDYASEEAPIEKA